MARDRRDRLLGSALHRHTRLHISIDEVLPLSKLADAYRCLENRQILGKLVMVPDDLLAAK